MIQEEGSSLGRVWQGKLLQEHSDTSATAIISSSLPCLLQRRTQCHDIHRVPVPLLHSHHTRRLLATLPAPETDLFVRTRTRHRVPLAMSAIHRTRRRSSEEPRWEHDMQDTPARSFETRNPTRPGGTPSGRAAAMGCPSRPNRSRASPSLKQRSLSTTKNEKQ
jgi:hypothetical protein